MKKMVKAQISVFVILAIIIAIAVAFAFVITKKTTDNEFFQSAELKPSVDSIRTSLVQCSENAGKDSLNLIGVQGGYFSKPEKRIDLSTRFVPYYFYEGSLNYPNKEKIESELSKAVDQNFLLCVDKININGFTISHSNGKTKTTINKDDVKFIIDMPIKINKEGKTMILQMKDAPLSINSALYGIIEVADYISESHKEDERTMCISCIGKIAIDRKVYVDFLDLSATTTLVIISENYTSSEPYSFEFLNKYKTNSIENNKLPASPVPGLEKGRLK